jgi:hypothetical protein
MEASRSDKISPARGTALAGRDLHHNALEELLSQYEREKYNLCTPITILDGVPPMHRVSVRVVQIDADTETYPIPGGDKVGLGKTALDKIAAAAGINWIPERCGQIDGYNDAHRIKYRAVCSIQDFDGRRRIVFAEKEVDLRGEPGWPVERLGIDTREFIRVADNKATFHMEIPAGTRASKCRECGQEIFWVETKNKKNMPLDPSGDSHFSTCPAKAKAPAGWERVYQQRSNIHSLAESKAKLRCIRAALGVPVSMPKDQAAKPFVVPALVPDLDVSDPEIKRMVAASLLGSQEALYGPRPLPVGLQTPVQDELEEIDVSAMTEEQEPLAAAAPIDPAIAGQQAIPFDQEPEMPPEETAASPCGLPITDAMLAAVDDTRRKHVEAIAAWVKHAAGKMPPDAIGALCQKLGTGFDPLTAPASELQGMIGALKAEIARVTK